MKKHLSLLLLILICIVSNAQDYLYWGYETCSETQTDFTNMIVRGKLDGATLTVDQQANETISCMGINTGGYIYYIDAGTNGATGSIAIKSTKANGFNPSATTTPIDNFDVNAHVTGGVEDFYVYMDIDYTSNKGWILFEGVSSENIYLASFQTNADGTASGLQVLRKIDFNTGTPFYIQDLAIDNEGNIFVLYRTNIAGDYRIYKIPAAQAIQSSETYTPVQVADLGYGAADTYYPSGLAFSSGKFFIANTAFNNNTEIFIWDGTVDENGMFFLNNPLLTVPPITNIRCGVRQMTAIPAASVTTPVHFGEISAIVKGGRLQVNWETTAETNNSHFDIEVSADGKNFIKAGEVKTKAIGGNSSQVLNYAFEKDLNNVVGMLGVSFILLIGLIALGFLLRLPGSARMPENKLVLALYISFIITGIAACNKVDHSVATANTDRVFVKITQVDIDGTSVSSKIVKAVNE